eukprot:CAMPEP_0171694030 /NCGR_PEP_ID=MMETSP0991-20121206/6990_1 /TAXON_ID=483369 /ORGANISM="non described non described, Strain CCMP2098" /LENGTH=41 /DNA_ID= /DNA_START= /DNA_END= /DNA_ORIENTATION=
MQQTFWETIGSTEMLWLGASAPLLYEAMLLLASTIAILQPA